MPNMIRNQMSLLPIMMVAISVAMALAFWCDRIAETVWALPHHPMYTFGAVFLSLIIGSSISRNSADFLRHQDRAKSEDHFKKSIVLIAIGGLVLTLNLVVGMKSLALHWSEVLVDPFAHAGLFHALALIVGALFMPLVLGRLFELGETFGDFHEKYDVGSVMGGYFESPDRGSILSKVEMLKSKTGGGNE